MPLFTLIWLESRIYTRLQSTPIRKPYLDQNHPSIHFFTIPSLFSTIFRQNHTSVLVFTILRPFYTIFRLESPIYTHLHHCMLILYPCSNRIIHLYSFSPIYEHFVHYFSQNRICILVFTNLGHFYILFQLELRIYTRFHQFASILDHISIGITHLYSFSSLYAHSKPYLSQNHSLILVFVIVRPFQHLGSPTHLYSFSSFHVHHKPCFGCNHSFILVFTCLGALDTLFLLESHLYTRFHYSRPLLHLIPIRATHLYWFSSIFARSKLYFDQNHPSILTFIIVRSF